MNKIELVQTHKLLHHLTNHFDVDAEEYEETAGKLKPEDIHRSKNDHKDAIWALFEDLETEMEAMVESSEGSQNPISA
jgi:hypothetical protein